MASDALPEVDYVHVLADLRARQDFHRRELDKITNAIKGIEGLIYEGPPQLSSQEVEYRSSTGADAFANLSMYDAAVTVLTSYGTPMTNKDIVTAIEALGKTISMRDMPMLYGAVKNRGDRSQIVRIGDGRDGKWSLRHWSNSEEDFV